KSNPSAEKAKPKFAEKQEAAPQPPPPKQPSKVEPEVVKKVQKADFIANVYHEDVVDEAAIRVLAKEFAANKKIKPADYTTEAYEKNDPKNRVLCKRKHEKCCFYLPREKREVGNYGGFMVSVKNSKPDPFEGIKHTELDVKYGDGKTCVVNHLAYFDWPDHTAPLNPAPTVGMLKLSRKLCEGNPITVHCSAGIGRSATFIAIDYASQKVREKADASMVEVVRDMRNQRYQAIQSAIQYVFLHICVLEIVANVSALKIRQNPITVIKPRTLQDNAIPRDAKFNEYMDSYVSMIKRYNKKVEAKQRERERTEEK
ncbi:unnamed protein product, partial [Nippostrongylus brasiliensis]|uniref:Protein-tyrosine phosphatase n=1 Tax=Nippostrongylus brasiliensis TaxID=27835 RepID=A0A0N4YD36_NIPBR